MKGYQSYKQLVDLEWAKAGTIWEIVGIGEFAYAVGYIEGVISQPAICVKTLKDHPEWFELIKESKHAAIKSSRARSEKGRSKGKGKI